MRDTSDVLIIGGGILGLCVAYQITQLNKSLSVTLLEKEDSLAIHQSGRNSGVIHSGIYYKPGSLKANNCREGKILMEDFCRQHSIPFELCGKVIVAVDESELHAIHNIFNQGKANGVNCRIIGKNELSSIEPHVQGIQAIHVPECGIVSYQQVCQKLDQLIKQNPRHAIQTQQEVMHIEKQVSYSLIHTKNKTFSARYIVNCAGLYSDKVAHLAGQSPEVKIIPFRGEYYELQESVKYLCKNLIYPVPNPSFPFLGVHFTRMIGGRVKCGPNAVLALAREGYAKNNISFKEFFETIAYKGFQKLAQKYWKEGLQEMRHSYSKKAFTKALQRLIPEIREEHLKPTHSGVRAQAVLTNGMLEDDFVIQENEREIHICNAPSPAATSSLNIGKNIANKIIRNI